MNNAVYFYYRNEKQESNRLKNLEEYRSTGFWPTKGRKRKVAKQTTPWAESKQRKIDTREKKMLKKEKKYMKEKEGKIKKKRRKKQKFTKDEIDELARDIALMKKLKHKKVRIISSIVKYVAGYSYRLLSDENTLMCVQIDLNINTGIVHFSIHI